MIGEGKALPARVHADPPKRFGSYELLEQLGQGGMAVVYRARVAGAAGPDVVLKAMLPNLCASKPLVDMFESEAKLTAQLRHPNIVQVSDHGIADGVPYLIMEYLDGRNLSQIRNALGKLQRRAPIGVAVAIARDLCRALGYAHHFVDGAGKRIQVIHRDVSPSNVMVQRDGSVKLLDFGVAKLSSVGGQEITASLKGKFAYMSPEQVNHEPIDRRCDVFAAGIVLHELFVGRRLFGTKSERETLRRVANAEATIPSLGNAEVPPELDEIVMRALSLRPRDRFESGTEMADALDATGLAAPPAELAKLIQLVAPRVITAITSVRAPARKSQASDDAETEIADEIAESTARGLASVPSLVVLPGDDAILEDEPYEPAADGDRVSKKVEVDKRELWGDATAPARPAALVIVADDTKPTDVGDPTDPGALPTVDGGPKGPASTLFDPVGTPAPDRDFDGGATDIYAARRLSANPADAPAAAPPRVSPSVIFDDGTTVPAVKRRGQGTAAVDLPAPFVPSVSAPRRRRAPLVLAALGLVVVVALVTSFVRRSVRVGATEKSAAHATEAAVAATHGATSPAPPAPAPPPPPPREEEGVSLVGLATSPDEPPKDVAPADAQPGGEPVRARDVPGGKQQKAVRSAGAHAASRGAQRGAPKRTEPPKQSVKEGRIVDPFEAGE